MALSEEDRELAEEGVAALGGLCDELRSDFEGMREDLDATVAEVVSDYLKAFSRVLPTASPMHKSIALLTMVGAQDSDLTVEKIEKSGPFEKPPLTVRVAIRHISMLQRAVALKLGIDVPPRAAGLRRHRTVVSERIHPGRSEGQTGPGGPQAHA